MSVIETINSYNRNDYQRDNFDSFLRKVGFKYSIPSIHVTGTNGKGSVCNYLSNIYIQSGRKVAMFNSPASKDITDMIKINNQNISEAKVEEIFNQYRKYIDKYDLSSFEIVTFVALSYFQSENVDLAVIECGMGGEIDATNIFKPILSIITNISVEHTGFLGVSISEIALHKAGIIKNDVPVLIGDIQGDALDVIVDKAKSTRSKIYKVDHFHQELPSKTGYSFSYRPFGKVEIHSFSKSSITDASLALEAINILSESLPVTVDQVLEGIKCEQLSARFEVHQGSPTIVIDGAHNPDAIIKLRSDMENIFPDKTIHVVFACFRDKNITVMLPEIALLGELSLTTFNHVRARVEADYFLYLEDYKFYEDHISLIKDIKAQYPDDVILVTGSLAFANLVHQEILDGKI